ncbi:MULTISPECIES: hypothetical protein [Agrobacterium]|uniref:DUF1794 domain-containing protein n=2 Tax=Agrobacterium rubi TaxID=28099 RepID=A0AAE7R0M3_9HYPH|nr:MULTISPECIES: hypothetical protein [Agrobacterium]MBP1877860.1 hypothetical protein [Agrobacterium rubi]MCL6651953.1 hypothetical protein [Agrobacterium rubi]NTE86387.1 hypothetical protein [Agrobacterium rubi]NTF02319.1 hypothetical protein [Agrobacterium rubi]NTF36563.1 hypothetical protein [Agrobacterium rubi]
MTGKLISMIALATALMAPPAMADESQFLSTLKGSWKGSGTVTTKIGSKPIKVNCTFDSTSSGPSLRMNGTCRGLLVIRRAISADLSASGTRYRGNYVGPSGIPSALAGSRNGNSINLSITWKRVINGDKVAAMTITKVGNNGLRLRTTDKDGAGGPTVTTADIQLTR